MSLICNLTHPTSPLWTPRWLLLNSLYFLLLCSYRVIWEVKLINWVDLIPGLCAQNHTNLLRDGLNEPHHPPCSLASAYGSRFGIKGTFRIGPSSRWSIVIYRASGSSPGLASLLVDLLWSSKGSKDGIGKSRLKNASNSTKIHGYSE